MLETLFVFLWNRLRNTYTGTQKDTLHSGTARLVLVNLCTMKVKLSES